MKAHVQIAGETLALAELWTGILAGPFTWALNEVVRHFAVAHECATVQLLALHMLTLAALTACAVGFLCAWKVSLDIWGVRSLTEGEDSRCAMATGGMILSIGFALVILATAIPQWTLNVCN